MDSAKDLLSKVSSARQGYSLDEKAAKDRATFSGAAIGSIIGLYYGYSRDKNMLAMGLIGAIAGALVSRMLAK